MKTSSLALAAVIAFGGLAAPAFAESLLSTTSFDADSYITRLEARGINAIDVNESGADRIRATVLLSDGSRVFQYFDENTLRPVAPTADPSVRVLTELDTGLAISGGNSGIARSLTTTLDD